MLNYGAPARAWETVVPADGADLAGGESDYLYVGTTGNITCSVVDSASSTGARANKLFSNLAVGYHPIRTTRILATGTTAALILSARVL